MLSRIAPSGFPFAALFHHWDHCTLSESGRFLSLHSRFTDSSGDHLPLMLGCCGYTACMTCVASIKAASANPVCPNCRKSQCMSQGESLIRVLEWSLSHHNSPILIFSRRTEFSTEKLGFVGPDRCSVSGVQPAAGRKRMPNLPPIVL